MKVAILYSGIPYFNENILFSHKQYIWDIYNPDIYLSTYLMKDTDLQTINSLLNYKKFIKFDIQNFYDIDYRFTEIEKYIQSKNSETQAINTISMFYKIYRCFSLIENNYDIIIRHRLDVSVDQPLVLYSNNGINVPCGGDHHGGLLDLFAFGSYTSMKIYCDLFQQLTHYLRDLKQHFHPESILRYHCNFNNLPIHRFDYNLYLRGQLFNQTAPCIK